MSTAALVKRALKKSAREVCSRPPLGQLITWRSTRARKRVALTFDDGPHPTYTPAVLDVLERFEARATFFVLGRQVEAHAELVRRIAGSGHEIGIHGYDHTLEDLPGQTIRTRDILGELGIETDLFRPPGGNLLWATELWMMRNRLRTVLWSYDLLDSMRHEGKVTTRAPLVEIDAGDVVLMHDDNQVCLAELPPMLSMLADRGLTPVTVSELYRR